ncbi:MAG TPA: MFS transporter [Candidatus Dormibacteraeota bacterium]|nr:MFS transporter [Candidatus Dormibacteraeota bacterium]
MQRKLHTLWRLASVTRLVTPGLSRHAWLLQAGVVLNFFGNGLVAPYLVIYLHFNRGIPLTLAALAIGSGGILATISGLVVGPLVDRFGPRPCVALAMSANAVAYAAYTQVHAPWQAVVVGMAVGVGTGAYGPSVQALMSGLVPPEQRAAALSQQRMSAIVGLSLGGLSGAALVAAGIPSVYIVLLLLDSATFLGFALLLTALPNPRIVYRAASGGYRVALGDPQLRLLAIVSLVMVGAGIAPMLLILPAFARGIPGVAAGAIGLIYAVNTAVVLLAQLRITRAVAGRSPGLTLATGAAIWTVAWGMIAVTGWQLHGWSAVAALTGAMAVYAIGECIYSAVVTPTAAAIAAPALRGRYLAVTGFAWQAGFMVGPPAAGALASVRPLAFPLVAAATCALLALALPWAGRTR